jgi:hypothetical protein
MATDILQQPRVAVIIGTLDRLANLAIKLVLLWWVKVVASCRDFVTAWPLNHEKWGNWRMASKKTCTHSGVLHLTSEVDALNKRFAKHQ